MSPLRPPKALHAHVFVSGGTGYVGSRLTPRAPRARAPRPRPRARRARRGSCRRAARPSSATPSTRRRSPARVAPCDTFVQLVGVAHPSPAKAALFRSVDLASAKASGRAAADAGVAHFVYVSVAQPAPAMKAYVAARAEGEAFIRRQGLDATFLRPWYVLGPGHRWPYLLLPGLLAARAASADTRRGPPASGSSRSRQMVAALVEAVETPARGIRVVDVPGIRAAERRLDRAERPVEWRRGDFSISTDPARLDRAAIREFLAASYWAPGVPQDVVDRSIEGSLSFGLYEAERQIGFARVITDRATFAYLADVYVLDEWRGRGLGALADGDHPRASGPPGPAAVDARDAGRARPLPQGRLRRRSDSPSAFMEIARAGHLPESTRRD